MCGRGASTLSAERACRIAGGARVRGFGKARTRYNLGPQGYVPVVLNGAGGGGSCGGGPEEDGGKENDAKKGGREVTAMRWGLVPAFAKRLEDYDLFKGGSSTFNARVESLESSGLWRRLLDSKRCIVLLDGFYEWKTVGKNKTPMFIRHADSYNGRTIPSAAQQNEGNPYELKAAGLLSQAGKPVLPVQATQATQETNAAANENENSERTPLMFAGLYDVWRRSEGETMEEPLESVTIITMDSEGTPVFKIHDRMPLLLTAETAAAWLDPQVPFAQVIGPALRVAEAHAKEHLQIYEVAPLVSQMKNDSPECMMPRKDYDAKTFSKGLGKFFAKKAAPDATATPPSPPRETAEQETETPAKRPAPAEGTDADETAAAPPAKVARTTASVPPSDPGAAMADTVILLDED